MIAAMEDSTRGQDPFTSPRMPPQTAFRATYTPYPSPSPPITNINCNKSGHAALVTYLAKGRDPSIAREATHESLPSSEDSPDEVPRRERAADGNLMDWNLLQNLAADALQAASITTTPPSLAASVRNAITDRSITTGQPSAHDEPTINDMSALRYISDNRINSSLLPSSELLPPLRHRVRTPANASENTLPSQPLPSFRSKFGDIDHLFLTRPSEQHPSPRSPLDGYRTLSPQSATCASPPSYPVNNSYPSDPTEHSSSNAGETPNANHSISTPGRSASISSSSIPDHMSIDGVANPEHISASYRCTHSGCNAGPFRRPFELTSHMTVHSSERLYYCQVQGCSRSEAGKGFKRKNELKRHGSTHNPPGYCCPFCPVRRVKRKYPRPDNLTRHVRGQHKDKDEDDPQLRNVLAQRPDGPNWQRRRRGRRS